MSVDGDDGLAAERTSLAWGRTSLALLGCGAAVLRGVPAGAGVEASPGAGAAIVALAGVLWVQSLWNDHRRRSAAAAGDPAVREATVRSMARATALVAAASFALVVIGQLPSD